MNVLIPVHRSDLHGGAETAVRDLALGLGRRGHIAAVFNDGSYTRTGRPMAAESITVVSDIGKLPFRPDVIHGHFGLETMIALSRLRGVPAVYQCHGGGPFGAPPRHPRIYRYLAISPSLAQRLIVESNIDESAMEIAPNGVDLDRFVTLRTPPERLGRALFYHNWHRPDTPTAVAVRTAAEACGMQLDFIGRRLERSIDAPEVVLPTYDLVFASGRSAIEALASGCCVIALGLTTCGEMVRPDNFERMRRANFSAAMNSPPPSAERIQATIDSYSPTECAAVTERLRREADHKLVILQMERVYAKAIEQHRAARTDRYAEHYAIAHYLRKSAPMIRVVDEADYLDDVLARRQTP